MIEKLEEIKHRFEEVGQLIVQPDIMSDMKRYSQLSKEYKDLEKLVTKFEEYESTLSNIENAKSIIKNEKDEEFREMAKMELDEYQSSKETLEEELKQLLIPKDPNDDKNAILEIRAGTGGDEAAIFAGDLFRMYQRYCEKVGLKLNVLDLTEGSAGGYKEIVSTITGENAYGTRKF